MDAVKFIEERKRLCDMHNGCPGCPAYREDGSCMFRSTDGPTPDEQVDFLEEWSATHPRKTRQSVFLKQYPETVLDSYGVPQFCPTSISAAHRDSNGACKNPERLCRDCRKEFWSKEIE